MGVTELTVQRTGREEVPVLSEAGAGRGEAPGPFLITAKAH